MADAISRVTSGRKIGAFCMQHGPGSENAYGGVAQAYGESVPILVVPMGYPRRLAHVDPNFNSTVQMRGIAKSTEPLTAAAEVPHVMRRAFTRLRNGRGGPVLVEVQALLAPSAGGSPRRSVVGWDAGRLSMLLAVLETRAGLRLGAHDVYLNIAGGLRVGEPAADLAVAAALTSAATDTPASAAAVYFGEVGLSGGGGSGGSYGVAAAEERARQP